MPEELDQCNQVQAHAAGKVESCWLPMSLLSDHELLILSMHNIVLYIIVTFCIIVIVVKVCKHLHPYLIWPYLKNAREFQG